MRSQIFLAIGLVLLTFGCISEESTISTIKPTTDLSAIATGNDSINLEETLYLTVSITNDGIENYPTTDQTITILAAKQVDYDARNYASLTLATLNNVTVPIGETINIDIVYEKNWTRDIEMLYGPFGKGDYYILSQISDDEYFKREIIGEFEVI